MHLWTQQLVTTCACQAEYTSYTQMYKIGTVLKQVKLYNLLGCLTYKKQAINNKLANISFIVREERETGLWSLRAIGATGVLMDG